MYIETQWHQSTLVSMEKWNEMGLPFVLRETADKKKADIIVSDDKQRVLKACKLCTGLAQVGKREDQNHIWLAPPVNGGEKDIDLSGQKLLLISHEFGHSFGLRHQNKCSLMFQNTYLAPCSKEVRNGNQYSQLCGPLHNDVTRLAKRYGEKSNSLYSPYCPVALFLVDKRGVFRPGWKNVMRYPTFPLGSDNPNHPADTSITDSNLALLYGATGCTFLSGKVTRCLEDRLPTP